jgi:DNA-binding NtrC family response regulator
MKASPVSPEVRSTAAAARGAGDAGRSSAAPRILLVDDDRAVRDSVRRVLAMEGWQVFTAESGEHALEELRNWEPDLLITDLRMGLVNGWDLLFHESFQRPHLPVFVITALAPEATSGAAKFAAEFFTKPLDFEALLAAIRRRLGPPGGTRKSRRG